MQQLLDDAEGVLPDSVELRRRIHAEPELGLELPKTQRLVLDALDGLGLDVRTGTSVTSVVADLEGGAPGPTILLRADMDALPMPEDTGLDYASTIDGDDARVRPRRARRDARRRGAAARGEARRARRAPSASCSSPAKKASTARGT